MSEENEARPETQDAENEHQQDSTVETDASEALAKENAELKDQLLRTVAEMENLRKRTAREIADTRSYAIASFARDMLVATDNLTRALMVVPNEARENADSTLKSLIDGIEMTEREMQRLLQKNGVTPIEAEGQKFDPHKHQAMFEVPNPNVPEGTVVQVMQAGFAIGDRILRPAMVGVAKGGPKAPKPEEAQQAANEGADSDDQQAERAGGEQQDAHIDKEA